MASAGYSGTPLARKLGIQAGHRLALVDAPAGFERLLAPLPEGVVTQRDLRGSGCFDVILLFAPRASALKRRFAPLSRRLEPHGGLWVAWPKKESGVATDLTREPVREHGLACGLVDNKVCAVDETWSGLRFVIRLEDRPGAR